MTGGSEHGGRGSIMGHCRDDWLIARLAVYMRRVRLVERQEQLRLDLLFAAATHREDERTPHSLPGVTRTVIDITGKFRPSGKLGGLPHDPIGVSLRNHFTTPKDAVLHKLGTSATRQDRRCSFSPIR
jgi:hypothetical protein